MGALVIEGEVTVQMVDKQTGSPTEIAVWTKIDHPDTFESTVDATRWIKNAIAEERLVSTRRYRVIREALVIKLKTVTKVVIDGDDSDSENGLADADGGGAGAHNDG